MTILCLGKRDVGKTTLAGSMAHYAAPGRPKPRVAIFDTRNQFASLHPITRLPHERERVWQMLEAGEEIVIQPENDLTVCSVAFAEITRQWIKMEIGPEGDQFRTGKLCVILDEAGLKELDIAAYLWHFRAAPRNDVTFILTAHRPVDLPPTVRALADWWCVFRTTEQRDLEVIEERCGTRFAGMVPRLSPRQFLRWDDSTSDPQKQIAEYLKPEVWYYPLNRPKDTHATRPLQETTDESVLQDKDLFS